MSGMNDMLANMLKNIIPKETLDMLSPEKVKEVGEKVTAFVELLKSELNSIKTEQTLQRNMLVAILEKLDDNNHNQRTGSASDANGSIASGSD
jgi:hypothetical protein